MANFLRGSGGTPAPTPNNATQNFANMVKSFRGMNNPQQLMQMLGQKNPQAMQQVQQIMQSGKNPKDFAMNLMKQRGINPDEFMKLINS